MSEHFCDNCGERPARVRYTEIKDDKKTELNLCENCARQKGLGVHVTPGKVEFGVSDILAGMMEEAIAGDDIGSLKCGVCSLPFSEFKQHGRLGCAACYLSFERQLRPLLKKIHGSAQHVGKLPPGESRTRDREVELKELRSALQTAITREDFEEAARLRDECRILERELEAAGKSAERRKETN